VSGSRVIVVGGGLAGLSAAVACVDAGACVTLLEARARLGGATWSTRRFGLEIDNGQHVFLRCFAAYRGFLRRLGVEDCVMLQPRLAVPVAAPGRPCAWIRRHRLPSPAHLAPSLLRFRHLAPGARLHAARSARRLAALDLADPRLDARRFGDWLAQQGESPAAIERFWDLLIRPTLNLPAADASLALAGMVYQTGLLGDPAAGDIGWARLPLSRVHAEPAQALLRAAGARIHLRSPVDRLECPGGGQVAAAPAPRPAVWVRGQRLEADALILATPHRAAARLLPPAAGVDGEDLRRLGSSPILNLHVVFDRPVMDLPFVAGVDTPLQWIFDRSDAAGLARGQYLVVSLSAAQAYLGLSRAKLRGIFLPALEALFPETRRARVECFFATCEREATFLQRPGTQRLRPGPRTASPGLFLAGAWTDTGWPATMEGAVRSGLAAARGALLAAGCTHGLPAEAA
jgi:squalene-associated FAD-dependent desaturase